MSFEVLCVPYFPADEAAALDDAARQMGTTPDVVIRDAVKFFAGECVPTHDAGADEKECA